MSFNEPNAPNSFSNKDKDDVNKKKCCVCKEIKPINKFCKRTRSKDGLSYVCRQCKRIADSKRGINIENYVNSNMYNLGPRDY